MSVDAIGTSAAQAATYTRNNSAGTQPAAPPLDNLLSSIQLPTPQTLARDTEAFAADLQAAFRDLGIGVPPEAVLTSDYAGGVRVANDHPDKARIEQYFQDNPDMQQRFTKISADSSLLRAAEHYSEFAVAYERMKGDVAAQSALVSAEAARNKAPYHMVLSADGADAFFSASLKA